MQYKGPQRRVPGVNTTVLGIGLAAAAVQLGLTGLATVDEDRQPWPPDGVSARFGLHWVLVMAMAGSLFAGVATNYGSLYPVGPLSLVAGGTVFLAGAAVNVLAADEMESPTEILGLSVQLRTGGPFRFSRHPEVAGHAGAVGGLAIASGAGEAFVLAPLLVGWFAIRPFAREPVLARRFDERYEQYRSRVARYLDVGRLRAALGER